MNINNYPVTVKENTILGNASTRIEVPNKSVFYPSINKIEVGTMYLSISLISNI